MDDEKEQLFFDNYNPSDLENVIERQKKILNYMKSKDKETTFNMNRYR